MTMATREFQSAEAVSRAATEAQQVAMQPIPKADAATRDYTSREFHRQWAMPGARDVLAQLFLVRGEDADSAPSTRDGHIPLLCVGRGLDGGVREQDVIHSLALRAVGRDGIAGQKLTKAGVQNPAIGEFNTAVGPHGLHSDKLAICDASAGYKIAIGFQVQPVSGRNGDLA